MKIMKFGGTSVGSPSRIREVAALISTPEKKIVVLSAMSGTTNKLVEICEASARGDKTAVHSCINELREKYTTVCYDLFEDDLDLREEAVHHILAIVAKIERLAADYSNEAAHEIVAQGEIMSTFLMTQHLRRQGLNVQELYAPGFMFKKADSTPDMPRIATTLHQILRKYDGTDIFITQGFICTGSDGSIDNLERGGSDYTATIIGAATSADSVEIWTDIDGVHNNDPRFVDNTGQVPHLSFNEAIALAKAGAKILHPLCVIPTAEAGIPVKILNTFEPKAHGTLIDANNSEPCIKAVAALDHSKNDTTDISVIGNFDDAHTDERDRVVKAVESIGSEVHINEICISTTIPLSNKKEVLNALSAKIFPL